MAEDKTTENDSLLLIPPSAEVYAIIYHETRMFVIPDVVKINLDTGEVELMVEVSEASKKFWECLQFIAGEEFKNGVP